MAALGKPIQPGDRLLTGRLPPHDLLETCHSGFVAGPNRPTSALDPLLPIVTGSYRESK